MSFRKTFVERNVTTANVQEKKHNEEQQEIEVYFVIVDLEEKHNQNKDELAMISIMTKENDLALVVVTPRKFDYKKHLIIGSGCLNHMTIDKKKLQMLIKYNEGCVEIFANNLKLLISHIRETNMMP